jgi:hypothetical protein
MIEAGMQGYALKLAAPARPTDEQLASVQTPVLVVMAGASRMHDAAAAADVAERALARGTVKTYPTASHALNGEHPTRSPRTSRRSSPVRGPDRTPPQDLHKPCATPA